MVSLMSYQVSNYEFLTFNLTDSAVNLIFPAGDTKCKVKLGDDRIASDTATKDII